MIIKGTIHNNGKFLVGDHLLTCVFLSENSTTFRHATGALHVEPRVLPVEVGKSYYMTLTFGPGFLLDQKGVKYRALYAETEAPATNYHTFKELALIVDQLGLQPAIPYIKEIHHEGQLVYNAPETSVGTKGTDTPAPRASRYRST